MAIPRPERDALEALGRKANKWSEECGKCRAFRLQDGTPLHLLGVSMGNHILGVSRGERARSMRPHIAVFGYTPPKGEPQDDERLGECEFGALLTGPEDGNLFTVEGLNFETTVNEIAVLSRNGHRDKFRSIV